MSEFQGVGNAAWFGRGLDPWPSQPGKVTTGLRGLLSTYSVAGLNWGVLQM